eukprot:m.764188 g.764188  ORF g.764188 m.764188 type:complete len:77 (+) comp59056_c0_seq40:5551-5781(+)
MAPVFNPRGQRKTLAQFFQTRRCLLCEELADTPPLCKACKLDKLASAVSMLACAAFVLAAAIAQASNNTQLEQLLG